MAEAAAMRAVLEAPGVKGLEVLRLPCDDDTNEKDAVTDLIRRIVVTADPPVTSAFSVLNLGKVVELFAAWRRGLKGMPPYYAVKCNTNPALLGALAALGAGFDCASPAEMDAVLALGVAPPTASSTRTHASPRHTSSTPRASALTSPPSTRWRRWTS